MTIPSNFKISSRMNNGFLVVSIDGKRYRTFFHAYDPTLCCVSVVACDSYLDIVNNYTKVSETIGREWNNDCTKHRDVLINRALVFHIYKLMIGK